MFVSVTRAVFSASFQMRIFPVDMNAILGAASNQVCDMLHNIDPQSTVILRSIYVHENRFDAFQSANLLNLARSGEHFM